VPRENGWANKKNSVVVGRNGFAGTDGASAGVGASCEAIGKPAATRLPPHPVALPAALVVVEIEEAARVARW